MTRSTKKTTVTTASARSRRKRTLSEVHAELEAILSAIRSRTSAKSPLQAAAIDAAKAVNRVTRLASDSESSVYVERLKELFQIFIDRLVIPPARRARAAR